MNFKKSLFFTFLIIIVFNTFSQEIEQKQEKGFVKSYDLLKSIKGRWKLIHLLVDGMEVDCEHFEKSLLKQIDTDKDNKEVITKQFNNMCKVNKDKIIEVSHNSIFDKNLNRMTFFKLDNDLNENTIIIQEGANKFEFKIIKVSDNYFKLWYTDKMWMKFKKTTN